MSYYQSYPNPNYPSTYATAYANYPTNNYYAAYIQPAPAVPEEQRIKHNVSYWLPLGILRLSIVLATFGGAISAWSIVQDPVLFANYDQSYQQTQDALIVFFSVFFCIFLVMFLMGITNFVNLPIIDPIWYLWAFIGIDAVSCISFLVLGITAAVRQSDVYSSPVGAGYRSGTFTACSVFAFYTAFVSGICGGYQYYILYQFQRIY